MACTIKSVTLAPSEPYVIPPGAIIIGSSNLGSIESACADLSQIEELECFMAIIGSSSEDGSVTEHMFWENTNRHRVVGYVLNGVRTLFPTPIEGPGTTMGCIKAEDILTALSATLPAITQTHFAYNYESSLDGDASQCLNFLIIKTIPSIGNNLSLILRFNEQEEDDELGGSGMVETLVQFKPFDSYSGYEGTGGVECPPDPEV